MSKRFVLTTLALSLTIGVVSAEAPYRKEYKPPPRSDISDDPTYVHMLRYCDTGRLEEAEKRATKLIVEKGYKDTRFECSVWLALARAYDKAGEKDLALEAYRKCYASCDDRKGASGASRHRILALNGTLPVRTQTASTARLQPVSAPRRPAPAARLEDDREYQQVVSYLRAAEAAAGKDQSHGKYSAALRMVQTLVVRYSGTASEARLQTLAGDIHVALATNHYKWAQESAQGAPTDKTRSRERSVVLERMVREGIPVAGAGN